MKTFVIAIAFLVAASTASWSGEMGQVVGTNAISASGQNPPPTPKLKSTRMEAQLNSGSVNPIVISRDRALGN